MKKTWVVVAEGSRARIFEANSRIKPMTELEDLSHPKSRAKVLDINADNAGKVYDRMGQGIHHMESEVDPKTHEADMFAKEVAEHIEKARATNRFEELVLVGEPKFIGMVRKHLHAPTLKTLVKTVSKNLIRADEETIRKAAVGLE